MCGIAGIFNYGDLARPVDRALVERMTRALAHRGPDGEGFHVDGPIGLGHRRLAIVDLSETGRQPMASPDESSWITYNGELYNHVALRRRLRDRRFRGTSDTETLLHLLDEEGAAVLPDLIGIFGFAWWDARRRRLMLARDHLGVKQVYYVDDGERILFASEIKALLACDDVPRELDPEAVNQYLHFHTALFDRTFFRHVRQLRPAEYLVAGDGRVSRSRYWALTSFGHRDRPDEAIATLSRSLETVVQDQLMADVPVGAFFSGGIDSSVIAAFAARSGKPPVCFGLHFANQGVVDERPFQEAAARALGVELNLMTLDGSSFADDLPRLLYSQDEPTIGAAMIPMYHVSKLAAAQVKVCLGGQAADEVFGGYARYALTQPMTVAAGWLRRTLGGGGGLAPDGGGGNLWKQLLDASTMRRLLTDSRHLSSWRTLYFEHFAKVPESAWRELVDAPELLSRASCRALFDDLIDKSPGRRPADKVMHWDVQTYLPGLFHQEDRMSMASGLESRVPFADPRLVSFAVDCSFDLKFREGSSKWILRRAVADVLPAAVLNRRKVGFDTPAELWMRGRHRGFVRDVLLSRASRQRGLFAPGAVASLLDDGARAPYWFDRVWKLLCIELWAELFQDRSQFPRPPERDVAELSPPPPEPQHDAEDGGRAPRVRDALEELRELGVGGTLFRTGWELKIRSRTIALDDAQVAEPATTLDLPPAPAAPAAVAEVMRELIPAPALRELGRVARRAVDGKILCFSRFTADFGRPIDWHLNPLTGRRWPERAHWSRSLGGESAGDVKMAWEVGRFPQAFHLARAAAFSLGERDELAAALAEQVRGFVAGNPYPLGVHWSSGQELALRMTAWLFAARTFGDAAPLAAVHPELAGAIHQSAAHIAAHFDYARKAVYNNHLLSEALGLLLAAETLPGVAQADGWRETALATLGDETARQLYPDGGYIQQSHNYHRAALSVYLRALVEERARGRTVPRAWLAALERSLDFLYAQQNPRDGRLPNYGANDGAQFLILTTCAYGDFRPVLQAVSLLTRGERLYPPGPWDELAVWLDGPRALAAPPANRPRRSVSFAPTGFHVLRGRDAATFATLRCGDLRDRFSQIDMLHVDVWWRGVNVLGDAGSYLYNAADKWHNHFFGTSSHNTVQLDGRDQMLHYRRFKSLYPTRATLLDFEDRPGWALAAGQHFGYQRQPGGCVHRRSLLLVKDDLVVVVDRVVGEGEHDVRLHWLAGELPFAFDAAANRLQLDTAEGPFCVTVLDDMGQPLAADVVAGQGLPPRGWLSRHYAEKVAVASLVVARRMTLPATLVSILSAGAAQVQVGATWRVKSATGATVEFTLDDGRIRDVETAP